MHRSVYAFAFSQLEPDMIRDRQVLEVGARDVNGGLRTLIQFFRPRSYLGIDRESGDGVDCVCDATELIDRFGPDCFDFVVCTEMLEHAREWRRCLDNMKGVLRPGGWLLLTTRSRGFAYHGFPHDYWRFEIADMQALFPEFETRTLIPDPQWPGVFFLGRRLDAPVTTPARRLHRMKQPAAPPDLPSSESV